MWKWCDAAEQLIAGTRQRKKVTKRAKQEPSRAMQTLEEQPLDIEICSILSFMQHIDGNNSAVIYRCCAVLTTVKIEVEQLPAPDNVRLGLTDAAKVGRMLQRELRRRSVLSTVDWTACRPDVG